MAFTISPVVQLLLCSVTLYTLYFLYQRTTTILNRRKFVQKHGCKAPAKYPHKDPVFGLDMLWGTIRAVKSKSYMARIRHLHQQSGNTYSSHYLLSPIIHTIEPDNLKAVLSTNFKDYGISPARKEAFLPLFGQSILVSDGALWEHSRGLLRPSFARSQVGDLAMFDGHVTNLLKSIPRDGSVVDLGDLFFGLTADVITDFMFGESIGSLTQPDSFRNHIMQAFHDVEFGAEERWRRGKFANYLPHSEFYKSVRQVHSFIDEHVAKAIEHRNSQSAKQESAAEEEEKTKERYILLRELGKVTDDRKQLRSELLTVFLAGRDTTASLLCNVFFVFARRPDIWRRLRIEVAELKGEKPTFAQLGRMDYLRSCLNECKCLHPNLPAPKKIQINRRCQLYLQTLAALRLHPPLPHHARVALKDTILPLGGGPQALSPVFVPANTAVNVDVAALHRRKDLWGEDAAEFRPERWTDGEKGGWVRNDPAKPAHRADSFGGR